jgi:hypothetical protein
MINVNRDTTYPGSSFRLRFSWDNSRRIAQVARLLDKYFGSFAATPALTPG